MEEQILNALSAKYSYIGLGEKTLRGVAATGAKLIKTEDEIATFVNGAETMLKSFQGETDSYRTAKTQLEKRVAEMEAKKTEGQNIIEPPKNPETPKDETAEMLKKLLDEVNSLKAQTTHKTFSELAEQKLKDKVVKEFYSPLLEGKTFSSEDEVNQFTTTIETVYKTAQQAKANEALSSMGKPGRGNGLPEPNKPTNEQLDAALEKTIKF